MMVLDDGKERVRTMSIVSHREYFAIYDEHILYIIYRDTRRTVLGFVMLNICLLYN